MTAAASKPAHRSLTTLTRVAVAWWLGELAGLVPKRLRPGYGRRGGTDIHVGRDLWVIRSRGGQIRTVDPTDSLAVMEAFAAVRGRRRTASATLVVPLSRCFARETALPRAMLGHAGAVLASELDTNTPFTAETAHWDWFVKGDGAEPGTVHLMQVVLKRRDTDRIALQLAEAGLSIAAIGVEDDSVAASPVRLPLDLQRHVMRADDEAARSFRKARGILVGAAVLTSLAIVPAAFYQQGNTLAGLDADISDTADQVATHPGLARAPLQALGDALTIKRVGPSAAQILDSLAGTLPPGTFLQHLYLDRDVLTIQGLTSSEHGLERALAASSLFSVGHNTASPSTGASEGVPFTIRLKTKPVPTASGA